METFKRQKVRTFKLGPKLFHEDLEVQNRVDHILLFHNSPLVGVGRRSERARGAVGAARFQSLTIPTWIEPVLFDLQKNNSDESQEKAYKPFLERSVELQIRRRAYKPLPVKRERYKPFSNYREV